MTKKPLTAEELRQWVLSLPPDNIRSLEDTLKSLRDFSNVEVRGYLDEGRDESLSQEEVMEDGAMLKSKADYMEDIDVSPPSRTTSPTSSNISHQSRNKSGKTYENGRRNLKEEDVSNEEAVRRAKRRERNRLAAAKCRKRRQDKIDSLQHRVSQLKSQMEELSANIEQYGAEHDSLNSILSSHKCTLHQQSTSAIRPTDLKLEKSQDSSTSSNNVFICSLSPQLINLSPLLTPATMKLLIDTINNQQNDSSSSQILKEESVLHTSLDSNFLTAISTSSNSFSQSLSLLNFMSPNSDLLNMNLLSSPSLKIAASLASSISAANVDHNQSDHLKHLDQ